MQHLLYHWLYINPKIKLPEFPSHALDPNVAQLVPLDGALKPYTPPVVQQSSNTPDFDLMTLVSEFEGIADDQLILASTQVLCLILQQPRLRLP